MVILKQVNNCLTLLAAVLVNIICFLQKFPHAIQSQQIKKPAISSRHPFFLSESYKCICTHQVVPNAFGSAMWKQKSFTHLFAPTFHNDCFFSHYSVGREKGVWSLWQMGTFSVNLLLKNRKNILAHIRNL